ncbi:MAG TPA: glycoside hydrolase family 15 protein [Flavisolibacter sp.]|nr:glycoside hydrolase family 15 protein [Flavisolibacter sp.]
MSVQSYSNGYLPIEDYGVIGNLHTIALVSLTGSIDYLPFMRIDSPTVFLKILDQHKGGYFSIHATEGYIKSSQFYLADTNILVTRLHTQTGVAEITDFMPVNEQEFHCAIIRQVKIVMGKVSLSMECIPAFDYARSTCTIIQESKGCLFTPQGTKQSAVRLTANIPLQIKGDGVVAQLQLSENDECFFLLEAEHSTGDRMEDTERYIKSSFRTTYDFWKQWVSKCTYHGPWKEVVNRSMLVLKLLISHTYGSPVAAATFGLPEAIGGERNWDYRYTWIRDAAFTMYVLINMGFYDEADKFIEWIKRQEHEGKLQLLYAVDGNKNLLEEELNHLEGYKGSTPVRIGNGAHNQLQMDIYGELLDTVYVFVKYARPITIEFWWEITEQINIVINNWKLPDHSIWEIREGKQEFLYSRLMCWVAMDRAIKIAEICSFPYPEYEWKKMRDEIFNNIFEEFWNSEKETFVQYKGSDKTDASMFMMPIVGFISPYSDYWLKTFKAIDDELVSDVLVYRYKDEANAIDRLKGKEGTFTICSFWYVIAVAKSGETEKANLLFEKLLGYANHLGLYAEQVSLGGQHLGNFPQAFTHLSLISAAIELSKEEHLRKKTLPPVDAPKMV